MYDSTYTRYLVRFIATGSRRVGAVAWGRGIGDLVFNGHGALVLQEEKSWRWWVVMDAQ